MKALVFIILILGITGVIVTYIIGYHIFEGTVTESPYETGLKWDKTNKQINELGWTIKIENKEFSSGTAELIFTIKDKNMNTLKPDKIDILISRPTTAKFDSFYKAQLRQKGDYVVKVVFPEFGYWDIFFKVHKDRKVVTLKESIYIRNEKHTF